MKVINGRHMTKPINKSYNNIRAAAGWTAIGA